MQVLSILTLECCSRQRVKLVLKDVKLILEGKAREGN